MPSESQHSSREHGSGVIVVGSITADVTTFSDRLPARGETVLGDDLTLVLGGKGANQAVASTLADAKTHLIGCVGNDLFREMVTGGLERYGVDISEVRAVDGPTGVAHIRVDASGENDIVIVPLANSRLSSEQIDAALDRLASRSSVLVAQLEVPSQVVCSALRSARARKLTVVLDPAPVIVLDPEIWASIDIVTPNETEASLITEINVTDFDSAIEAGRWFCARGTQHAVITLAAAGAVLVSGDTVTRFDPFQVDAVDTTAAGDAFTGYLVASLAQGLDLHDAIRRAMAAGALAVTQRGASPSLPRSEAVEALLWKAR